MIPKSFLLCVTCLGTVRIEANSAGALYLEANSAGAFYLEDNSAGALYLEVNSAGALYLGYFLHFLRWSPGCTWSTCN